MADSPIIVDEKTYLSIALSGPQSLETFAAHRERAVNACAQYDRTKLLADLRECDFDFDLLDLVADARSFANDFQGIRVALVVSGPIDTAERFYESAAMNRGATLRLTTTTEAAVDWLNATH